MDVRSGGGRRSQSVRGPLRVRDRESRVSGRRYWGLCIIEAREQLAMKVKRGVKAKKESGKRSGWWRVKDSAVAVRGR